MPYAYGALYNHPLEGFLLDTLGAGIAYLVTGMTARQSIWFFTCSTIKTVDDHCGYALPFDPLQRLTSNNAGYHDVHHQSWGIKTNFSQPFFTFWDRVLGTMWQGDTTLRYERDRKAAERRSAMAKKGIEPGKKSEARPDKQFDTIKQVEGSLADQPISKEGWAATESLAEQLKGLHERVDSSLQGKGSIVMGIDSRS